MDKEPKVGRLAIAIGGFAMVACCLAPVLLASAGTWVTSRLGGFDPIAAVAIAAAAGIVVYAFRRRSTASKSITLPMAEVPKAGGDSASRVHQPRGSR